MALTATKNPRPVTKQVARPRMAQRRPFKEASGRVTKARKNPVAAAAQEVASIGRPVPRPTQPDKAGLLNRLREADQGTDLAISESTGPDRVPHLPVAPKVRVAVVAEA